MYLYKIVDNTVFHVDKLII